MTRLLARLVALTALCASAPFTVAQTAMTTRRVASSLQLPVFVTAPRGDTSRLFIVEQGASSTARIKILDLATETVLPTPFLTISGISAGAERGLLGLAFHPDYASNGYFYVYVSDSDVSNSVWRYTVSGNPNIADAGSLRPVIGMPDPWLNHNGGWIAFGPDGYLYVATGESGSGVAQDLNNLLGKMLRIDVDGDAFPSDPNRNYAIPPTNPFVGTIGADEVWLYGLRNPWRAAFDRANGDLYIGDVGQSAEEEIDFQPASVGGLNFGWQCMEGDNCTGMTGCTCNAPNLTDPITTYSHGSGCAVMGGYVYRGAALCGLQGTYFFADYCSARIWSCMRVAGGVTHLVERTAELHPPGSLSIGLVSSFGEDAAGELYICDHSDGEIYRIVAAGPITDCNANGIDDACDIANGTSLDADGDGIPDECASSVTRTCPGDGTAGACPCGNNGATGHGCQNSASTGGALLTHIGKAELSHDTLALTCVGELPSALSICLQGDVEIAPHNFGDGLRCAGGVMKRLYVKHAVGGVVVMPAAGDRAISARSATLGSPILPGTIRVYQVYYRDPSGTFCPNPPGATFNASGGLRARWGL
ncbi:MAG TPA: PQQ-dependent sugar dehydrogenase [Planctomycetota bacterium]|jgi:glucose/arabinose dehydrogenase|nr:PQQ-dependent sugar dehydrogenase [Planctomycetota bacterium]